MSINPFRSFKDIMSLIVGISMPSHLSDAFVTCLFQFWIYFLRFYVVFSYFGTIIYLLYLIIYKFGCLTNIIQDGDYPAVERFQQLYENIDFLKWIFHLFSNKTLQSVQWRNCFQSHVCFWGFSNCILWISCKILIRN